MTAVSHPLPAIDVGALARWLTDVLAGRVEPDDLTMRRPSGGGWSNDTLFVDIAASGTPSTIVVRLAPAGPSMFPEYDLGRQCAVMQAVRARGAVPVPAILGADLDGAALGRPAFAMTFAAGRVPADDRPSFAETGFLFDASPGEQRAFHIGLLDAIVAIHRTACDGPVSKALASRDALASVDAAVDGLAQTWAFDQGDRCSPVVDDVLARLRVSAPVSSGDVLLWGDARPANVVVAEHGFDPVALLDWELATIGPPEMELTWLAEMNRMRMQGSGVTPLPGFLDDDAAASYYEQRSGRRLANVPWYQLLAATRIAVLMHRHLRVMVHVDRLPADHRLLSDNIATRRLAELAKTTG